MSDSADDVFIRVESVDSTRDYIVYNEDEVSSGSSQSDHVGYIDDDDYDEMSDCVNNDNHNYGSDCISIDLENNNKDYNGEEPNQNDDNNKLKSNSMLAVRMRWYRIVWLSLMKEW